MSTLEDFDRILAELSPPSGAAAAPSAPVTTTTSASVSVTAPPARSTVQPPRPSVSMPAEPAPVPKQPSSGAPASNAAKIAELESLLADLGPVHPSTPSSNGPRSNASGAAPTSNGTSSYSASSNNTTSSFTAPHSSAANGASPHNPSQARTPASNPSAPTNTNTASHPPQGNSSNAQTPQAPNGVNKGINNDKNRTASISVSRPAPTSNGDAIVCGQCHGQITGTYIAALDKNWHPEHFVCSSCTKSLDGNFFETDKGILCTECASEQIRCTECHLPITGTHLIYSDGRPVHNECVPKSSCGRCHNILSLGDAHVEALDKLWHPECFACTRCMTPLGSTFVQYEGTPYCQPCIQILSKERNIVFKS